MEDWGELALLYLDQIDPAHVWGMDLDNIMEALHSGGLTREEAGAVARWLFVCLPAHASDGGQRTIPMIIQDTDEEDPLPERRDRQIVH